MLMRLSTKGRYGLRLLYDIALHDSEGPVSVSDIARRQNISVKYLEKLIAPLKRANLISSHRGPKGGHKLLRPPEEISLGEVIRLLEGEVPEEECILNQTTCKSHSECFIRKTWREATQAMYNQLNAVTFADLAGKEKHCMEIPDLRISEEEGGE